MASIRSKRDLKRNFIFEQLKTINDVKVIGENLTPKNRNRENHYSGDFRNFSDRTVSKNW